MHERLLGYLQIFQLNKVLGNKSFFFINLEPSWHEASLLPQSLSPVSSLLKSAPYQKGNKKIIVINQSEVWVLTRPVLIAGSVQKKHERIISRVHFRLSEEIPHNKQPSEIEEKKLEMT